MSRFTLDFRSRYEYDPGLSGISLEVALSANDREAKLLAKMDTGAQNCIFNRLHGEILNLEIERGVPQEFQTATGGFRAFGHEITLKVLDLDLDIVAYFAENRDFPRNVLGRYGWLQQIRLGLIDYKGQLFFSHFDDQ